MCDTVTQRSRVDGWPAEIHAGAADEDLDTCAPCVEKCGRFQCRLTSADHQDLLTAEAHVIAVLCRMGHELRGELAELERAWQDAEEIGAIADSLLLPPWVEEALNRLR